MYRGCSNHRVNKGTLPCPGAYCKAVPTRALIDRPAPLPILGFLLELLAEVSRAPEKGVAWWWESPATHMHTQTHTGEEPDPTGWETRPGRPAGEEPLTPRNNSSPKPQRGLLPMIRPAAPHTPKHLLAQPAEGPGFVNSVQRYLCGIFSICSCRFFFYTSHLHLGPSWDRSYQRVPVISGFQLALANGSCTAGGE